MADDENWAASAGLCSIDVGEVAVWEGDDKVPAAAVAAEEDEEDEDGMMMTALFCACVCVSVSVKMMI